MIKNITLSSIIAELQKYENLFESLPFKDQCILFLLVLILALFWGMVINELLKWL